MLRRCDYLSPALPETTQRERNTCPVWSRWTVPWTRTRLDRRVCGCVGAWERKGERGGLVVEEDATEYVYTLKK